MQRGPRCTFFAYHLQRTDNFVCFKGRGSTTMDSYRRQFVQRSRRCTILAHHMQWAISFVCFEGTLAAVAHAMDDNRFMLAAVLTAKSSMHHPCISRAVDRLISYASRALLRQLRTLSTAIDSYAGSSCSEVVDAPSCHITCSGRINFVGLDGVPAAVM